MQARRSEPVYAWTFFAYLAAASASALGRAVCQAGVCKQEQDMAKKKTTTDKPARMTLAEAHALGKSKAASDATFIGWRKLPGKERTMAGRFSDGTVVYRRRGKNAWISERTHSAGARAPTS